MARKINTVFVAALITTMLLIAVSLVGLWVYITRESPQERITRGNHFYAQQNYERAAEQYGKVLRKDATDIDLILRYTDAVSRFEVDSIDRARLLFEQMRKWWGRALELDPTNEEALDRLMNLYIRMSKQLGDQRYWDLVYDRADSLLLSQSNLTEALKYRGIAQVQRIRRLRLNEPDQKQAVNDLESYLEAVPSDIDTRIALAQFKWFKKGQVESQGIFSAQADTYRDEALAVLSKVAEDDPTDAESRLVLGDIYLALERPDDAQKLARELIGLATASELKDYEIERTVSLLQRAFREPSTNPQTPRTSQGLERARIFLVDMIEKHPESLRLSLIYGRLLDVLGRGDEALELFEEARKREFKCSPLDALSVAQFRRIAGEAIARHLIANAASAKGEERDKNLQQADLIIKEISENYGEIPSISMLKGRIALARKKWREAATHLDAANVKLDGKNVQALLLAAIAHRNLGTIGVATERIEQILAVQPNNTTARAFLAELYLDSGQINLAENQIEQLLAESPDNEAAVRLQIALLNAQGHTEKAIDLIESLGLENQPRILPMLAQLYQKAGRTDAANNLILKRLEQDPTNIRYLQMAIRLRPDSRDALLARAKENGLSDEMFNIISSQFDASVDTLDLITDRIDKAEYTDPTTKHIEKFRLLSASGHAEEAEAEFLAMEKLDPDHPIVIRYRFEEALRKRDWATARAYAESASKMNLDHANGLVFLGRIQLASGNPLLAVSTLTRATKINRLDIDVWLLLGGALATQGDFVAAQAAYTQAHRLNPNNPKIARGMAITENSLGNHKSALKHFREAARHAPQDTAIRETYIAYEFRYGDKDTAIAKRKKILADTPDDLTNHRALVLMLIQNDDLDGAKAQLQSLIEAHGIDRNNAFTRAQTINAIDGYEPARASFVSYIENLGENAEAIDWLLLGKFDESQGRNSSALEAYAAARKVESSERKLGTRQYADALFKLKRFSESTPIYQTLWDDKPDDTRIGLRLTESLFKQDRIDEAESVLERTMASREADSRSLLLGGMIAHAKGQYSDAVSKLNQAIEFDPGNASIYYQLAVSLLQDPSNASLAITRLTHAIQLNPNLIPARVLLFQTYENRGQIDAAVTQAREIQERVPDFKPIRHQLFRLYQNQNRSAAAYALLEDAIKRYPDDPTWLDYRISLDLSQNRLPEAESNLNKRLKIASNPQSILTLVNLQIQQKRTSEALNTFNTYREKVDKQPTLLAAKGRTMVQAGKLPEARKLFRRAMSLSANYAQVGSVLSQMAAAWPNERLLAEIATFDLPAQRIWIGLSLAQDQASKGLFSAALKELARIESEIISGTDEKKYLERMQAICYYSIKDYQKARIAYESLLEQVPNDIAALNNFAFMLAHDLGEPNAALIYAERAQKLMVEASEKRGTQLNPQVLDTLGWVKFKNGDLAGAEKELRRSFGIKPLPQTALHLATLLSSQGSLIEPIDLLKQAKRLTAGGKDPEMDTQIEQAIKTLEGGGSIE